MTLEYRSVFLSDTHLGLRGARAAELSAFLKHVRCERLYLVGDIIDCWALRGRWHWPLINNQVVRRILKHAKRGTHVVYIPGNHDDSMRQYAGMDFGGVRVALRAVHRMADGRSFLITHGDEFDLIVQHHRLLSLLGSWAYDRLILLNRSVNSIRAIFGLSPWSFSRAVKLKIKRACSFISSFEQALLGEAKKRGLDGVICGHIHQPALRDVPEQGQYANCGDWVEHPSALVEHADGRLESIDPLKLMADAGITFDVEADVSEPLDVPLDLESVM